MKYSADLLAELPVKFLLSAAESQQARLEGMFPSLLRHAELLLSYWSAFFGSSLLLVVSFPSTLFDWF